MVADRESQILQCLRCENTGRTNVKQFGKLLKNIHYFKRIKVLYGIECSGIKRDVVQRKRDGISGYKSRIRPGCREGNVTKCMKEQLCEQFRMEQRCAV